MFIPYRNNLFHPFFGHLKAWPKTIELSQEWTIAVSGQLRGLTESQGFSAAKRHCSAGRCGIKRLFSRKTASKSMKMPGMFVPYSQMITDYDYWFVVSWKMRWKAIKLALFLRMCRFTWVKEDSILFDHMGKLMQVDKKSDVVFPNCFAQHDDPSVQPNPTRHWS